MQLVMNEQETLNSAFGQRLQVISDQFFFFLYQVKSSIFNKY